MPPNSIHLDESVSAAPGVSPGVVEDDELLLREMFDPQHVKNGNLIEQAISIQDLRHRGFSVHRMKYVTAEFIKMSVHERLTRPRTGDRPWKDEGVATLKTGEVRSFHVDDQRAFVVIDTALDVNPGHASIFAAAPKKGPAHARKLRSLLLPLLQTRSSVDTAYA